MRHEVIIKSEVHPIVEELTKTRLAWGLSIKDVARRIGCSHWHLYHVEAGERDPSLKMISRWAKVLSVDFGGLSCK